MQAVVMEKFGMLNGKDITVYTMENRHGMRVSVLDYGCTITEIIVPDKQGTFENVVVSLDSIEEYDQHYAFLGAVIGRFAGRIKGAEFELDDVVYQLPKNDGDHHLHGGRGFDRILWKTSVIEKEDRTSLIFTHFSPHLDQGFPGNLQIQVNYTLTESNLLQIDYYVQTDRKTIINLTNHTYFNLSGQMKRTILDHKLTVKSNTYLPLDVCSIPTGEMMDVNNSVFDLRKGRYLREATLSDNQQNIIIGHGFDHPFLLNRHVQEQIVLNDSQSGRLVTIETSEPTVVVYTGNNLDGSFKMNDKIVQKYDGICLETQAAPDFVNQSHFPSHVIDEQNPFHSSTSYHFSIKSN